MTKDVRERFEAVERQHQELRKLVDAGFKPVTFVDRGMAGPSYVRLCTVHDKFDGPTGPAPFKFEVGQEVTVAGECGARYTILCRERHSHVPTEEDRFKWNGYQLNNLRWIDETCLSLVPPTPRFRVGEWVRVRAGKHLCSAGPGPVGRVLELLPNPPSCKGVDSCRILTQDVGIHEVAITSLEPWMPREGEWVMHLLASDLVLRPFQFKAERHLAPEHFIPAPMGERAEEWFR